MPLPGGFNVSNALCAVALAGEAGLDPHAVADGLGRAGGVPGRLERIETGAGFLAIVDYAHKPDALEAAVAALRPLTTRPAGAGDRRRRRPRPGQAPGDGRDRGARLADVLVVTDDNPRSEDPAAIRSALLEGTRSGSAEVVEVGDRRAAIRHAIADRPSR